jgi:hypothetical protein
MQSYSMNNRYCSIRKNLYEEVFMMEPFQIEGSDENKLKHGKVTGMIKEGNGRSYRCVHTGINILDGYEMHCYRCINHKSKNCPALAVYYFGANRFLLFKGHSCGN